MFGCYIGSPEPSLSPPPQYAQTLSTNPASSWPFLIILPYHNLRTTAIPATKKLHAAHTKFPVGYPLLTSAGLQIHCATI